MKTNASSIDIRNLYKIFGSSAKQYVQPVRDGLSKGELSAKHGHILGLSDINISIPSGKIQVIMGLSGSGKSTLIRHINRLIEPTAGSVIIDGTDVLKMSETELRDFRRSNTAMVFQKFGLLPHRTVIDNVTFGLEVRGFEAKKSRDIAMRWIERVGLTGFEMRYPDELSGGMQQRVGLARALSKDAPILMMDEAYSALDPLIRTDMQTMLLDLQSELRKTVVFITHDLDEALRLGDRIVILRDGCIVQQGESEDILLRPADEYIRRFVKDVNRGRFITAQAVMSRISTDSNPSLPTVRPSDTLEACAKILSATSHDRARVVTQDGRDIGIVSLRQITAAIASQPDETRVNRPNA